MKRSPGSFTGGILLVATASIAIEPRQMRICSKLGNFFGIPSFPKGDRDGTGTGSAYYSNSSSDVEERNTGSHKAVGGLEHVYFTVFRPIAAFIQSIKRG